MEVIEEGREKIKRKGKRKRIRDEKRLQMIFQKTSPSSHREEAGKQ